MSLADIGKAPTPGRPEYVWKFDVNRRKYKPGSMGPPIWREHWGRHKIIGENRVSYLLEHGGKVPKKADERSHVFSEEHLNELVWANTHRMYIVNHVAHGLPVAKLREVAAVIGYDEKVAK